MDIRTCDKQDFIRIQQIIAACKYQLLKNDAISLQNVDTLLIYSSLLNEWKYELFTKITTLFFFIII